MALSDNLLRAYNFNSNSTDSKSGYNGTDYTVSYSTGKISNALVTDGNNSHYVSAVDTGLPLGANAFSASVWIKTSATSGAVYSYGTDGGLGSCNTLLMSAGKIMFLGNYRDLTTTFTVNDNTWHHIVVTYDGTTLKLYADNSLKNSGNIALNVLSSGNIYFGKVSFGYYPYNGSQDIAFFWNRAITTDEIAELYNSGAGKEYPFVTETILVTDVTGFIITGNDSILNIGKKLITSVTNYSVTGINIIINRGLRLISQVTQYLTTGNPTVLKRNTHWENINKSTTDWHRIYKE